MIHIDIEADLHWVDGPWIYFRQADSRGAATHGELVIAAS
jgi:hypothetical protein